MPTPNPAHQEADRTNENPAVGTCSIRGTYDALGGRFENDTHDQYPQYPRVMAGAVARFPARDVHSQDK